MAKTSGKKITLSKSDKIKVQNLAVLSYLLLILVIICFFLFVTYPKVFTSVEGNIALITFSLLLGFCGRIYLTGALFIVGTFIIYARTNNVGIQKEGIEGNPPVPSSIDPNARSPPEFSQFVSINERGEVITSKPFVGNDGTRDLTSMKPVPMVARDPFVWSWDTKNAIKDYAKKYYPNVDPKDFLDSYTERYNTSATDQDVQTWLTPTPVGGGNTLHMWPWSQTNKDAFKRVAYKYVVELQGEDESMFNMFYPFIEMLSRHSLTDLNVEVLARSTFLFDKWIKYAFEIVQMNFGQ